MKKKFFFRFFAIIMPLCVPLWLHSQPVSPTDKHAGVPGCNDEFVFEDVLQYIPAASFYILKLGGAQSAHNYADATALVVSSYCVTAATTLVLKNVVDARRPCGHGYDSFPSGHAAVAFMGAEFLRMEYKDTSPWVGYAGYSVAAATAVARVIHDEHRVIDVVAGAGIGFLGTKLAYWVCPSVHKLLFGKKRRGGNLSGMPYVGERSSGIFLAVTF